MLRARRRRALRAEVDLARLPLGAAAVGRHNKRVRVAQAAHLIRVRVRVGVRVRVRVRVRCARRSGSAPG